MAEMVKVAAKKSHTPNQIRIGLHYNNFAPQYYKTTILTRFEPFI